MLFSQLRCRGQKEPPARICGLRAGRRLCPGTDSTAPLFRDRVVLRKRGQSGQRIGVSPVLTSTVSPRRGVSRRKPRKSFEVSRVAATSSAVGRSPPKKASMAKLCPADSPAPPPPAHFSGELGQPGQHQRRHRVTGRNGPIISQDTGAANHCPDGCHHAYSRPEFEFPD